MQKTQNIRLWTKDQPDWTKTQRNRTLHHQAQRIAGKKRLYLKTKELINHQNAYQNRLIWRETEINRKVLCLGTIKEQEAQFFGRVAKTTKWQAKGVTQQISDAETVCEREINLNKESEIKPMRLKECNGLVIYREWEPETRSIVETKGWGKVKGNLGGERHIAQTTKRKGRRFGVNERS